jgi:glycosyltransferase involved in cell wall biosynthesis
LFARAGRGEGQRNEWEFEVGNIFIKLLITIQGHFQSFGDEVFSHHLTYEHFWKRYLGVFDSVLVVARVRKVDKVPDGWGKATGVGVEFCRVADYQGPWEYLRVRGRVDSAIKDAIRRADAYLLRVPGMIGTLVWKQLPKGTPFGVEVVIDPWAALAPTGIKDIWKWPFRLEWTWNLKRQCKQACVASYVTKNALQKRYPPNPSAYTTYFSSVKLDKRLIKCDLTERLESLKTLPERLSGNGKPVRLGFVGSFSQRYKLPDVHIKAAAECIYRGANIVFEMVGDGNRLDDMKILAKKLGIGRRVYFRGRLPGSQAVMKAIDGFDLMLNATKAEGLPRVVIEAMARGCPCIASRVVGTPEIVPECFLVKPGNIEDLAETVLERLSEPETLANVVKENVRLALYYCDEMLQPRREQLYRELWNCTKKAMNLC